MREAQKKYQRKSEVRERYFNVYLQFHKINDADVVEKLQKVPTKAKYIKELIRKDKKESHLP